MFRSDAIFRDYSQTIILSIVKRNCNIHCVVRVLYNYCKIHLKCYRNCKQHNVFYIILSKCIEVYVFMIFMIVLQVVTFKRVKKNSSILICNVILKILNVLSGLRNTGLFCCMA